MTIYQYLKEDHNEVKDLLSRIEELGEEESEERVELFNTLKEKVIVHSKAEEQVFYKELKRYNKTEEEAQHGQEEHKEAEELLEALTDSSLQGREWFDKFLELKEALEHHIEEEEQEIFADAKDVLDSDAEERMEERMKTMKEHELQTRDIEPRKEVAA